MVHIAYFLVELITIMIFYIYASFYNKKLVTSIMEIICLPPNFEVKDKMAVSINSIADTMNIAKEVSEFCKEKGIDDKRANAAGLSIEEMVGNVILHGFTKDKKTSYHRCLC